MKLGEASTLPLIGQRCPAVGGWSSQRPHGQPHSVMLTGSGVAASKDATAGYDGAMHTPWEAVSPPGEGWARFISVTCPEKEAL